MQRLTDQQRQHRAVTEKQLQTRIIQLARQTGWRVAHFHDSRRQVAPGKWVGDTDARGFPDLILCRPPELLALELKRELGKTTDEQRQWLNDLRRSGVETHVVRPSSEADIIARLARPRAAR